MKIVVCVKQVPGVDNAKLDEQSGNLIREGICAVMNPFCEYALNQAEWLKNSDCGNEIIAVSMGPPQAEKTLIRCLELGADKGILISDRRLAGADTMVTASVLAATINKFVPDYGLILVGKKTIDGETSQVGPMIAEMMRLPQILYGTEIRLTSDSKKVQVKRVLDSNIEVIECILPALVSVSKGEESRKMPSIESYLAAREKKITRVDMPGLGLSRVELGLSSQTQVVKMHSDDTKKKGRKVEGLAPILAAKEIAGFLRDEGFIR